MEYWAPDVLGAGFERFEIDLGEDDEGKLVATLVRALPAPRTFWQRLRRESSMLNDVDVLYVHGWNDYFFEKNVAEFFTSRGARFFALDLRKYGRSLREGQTPGYIEDLASYDAEIGSALQLMGHHIGPHNAEEAHHQSGAPQPAPRTQQRRLLLHGHSTGGLVLSLWSARHRGVADGILLNSPWLTLQVGGALRRATESVVSLRAHFSPRDNALPQFDMGFYHEAQRLTADPDEPQPINHDWVSIKSPPVRAGWLRAILAGHALVDEGIDVGAPVCVQISDQTIFALAWRDDMTRADTVIDVKKVARASLKLGAEVTVQQIRGALHNVFLSQPAARKSAFDGVDRWLRGWAASDALPSATAD